MSKTRTHLFLSMTLLSLLAALGIGGCGNGEETAAASLPKVKFIKQADLICSNASIDQAKKAASYVFDHPGAKEVDLVLPAAIPPLERELDELEELGGPSGEEEEFAVYLEEFAKALDELKAEPKSALSPADNPFKKANKLATELQSGDCSQTP
ncbi:MAG: hypothetical protein ACTHNY_02480 [Solirubrobacterales bacterium]